MDGTKLIKNSHDSSISCQNNLTWIRNYYNCFMNKIQLAGCVVYNKGKILLIHRNSLQRVQWELPGGKIEKLENPEKAARRELLEELGIEVSIIKKLGEKKFQEDGYTMDYIWFLAEIIKGEPILKEDKFDDLRYFEWEELKDEKLILSANVKNLVHAHFYNTLLD